MNAGVISIWIFCKLLCCIILFALTLNKKKMANNFAKASIQTENDSEKLQYANYAKCYTFQYRFAMTLTVIAVLLLVGISILILFF